MDQPGPAISARGLVFILSGPSGVGKDAVRKRLIDDSFPITFCVTATSRKPRQDEEQGVAYHFIDPEDFERLERNGELLEHAIVHGRHYGVPIQHVREGLAAGNDIFITVDVQGGETIRTKLSGAITIFLEPPSLHDLVTRLMHRNTEDEAERALRMADARKEMERKPFYDYVVVNEDGELQAAVDKIKAIITAERCRVAPRYVEL